MNIVSYGVPETVTEKIAESKNIGTLHKKQIDSIKSAMSRIKNIADCDVNNTEIYGEMLEKIVIPSYPHLHIYLSSIPTVFI